MPDTFAVESDSMARAAEKANAKPIDESAYRYFAPEPFMRAHAFMVHDMMSADRNITEFDAGKRCLPFLFIPPTGTYFYEFFGIAMEGRPLVGGLSLLCRKPKDGDHPLDPYGKLSSLVLVQKVTGWMRLRNLPDSVLKRARILKETHQQRIFARLYPADPLQGFPETVVEVLNYQLHWMVRFPLSDVIHYGGRRTFFDQLDEADQKFLAMYEMQQTPDSTLQSLVPEQQPSDLRIPQLKPAFVRERFPQIAPPPDPLLIEGHAVVKETADANILNLEDHRPKAS